MICYILVYHITCIGLVLYTVLGLGMERLKQTKALVWYLWLSTLLLGRKEPGRKGSLITKGPRYIWPPVSSICRNRILSRAKPLMSLLYLWLLSVIVSTMKGRDCCSFGTYKPDNFYGGHMEFEKFQEMRKYSLLLRLCREKLIAV